MIIKEIHPRIHADSLLLEEENIRNRRIQLQKN